MFYIAIIHSRKRKHSEERFSISKEEKEERLKQNSYKRRGAEGNRECVKHDAGVIE